MPRYLIVKPLSHFKICYFNAPPFTQYRLGLGYFNWRAVTVSTGWSWWASYGYYRFWQNLAFESVSFITPPCLEPRVPPDTWTVSQFPHHETSLKHNKLLLRYVLVGNLFEVVRIAKALQIVQLETRVVYVTVWFCKNIRS